jgi:hypothetical protein
MLTFDGAIGGATKYDARMGNGLRLNLGYVLLGLLFPAPLLAQGQTLYFPRFATSPGTPGAVDNSEFTGIAVVNLDPSAVATLTFTAYDKAGALIAGEGITNPAVRTLAAGAQMAVVDFQIFGAAITGKSPTGWIKVDSTVQRVVGFFLVFNGSLTVLDGADVSGSTMSSFVLPEIEEAGLTQVHVANPNTEAAALNFELLNKDGIQRAVSSRSVRANGAVAESVTELFPGVGAAGSDYIRATSDKGVVGFELAGKAGVYTHGLNGQSTAAGAATLYCPQYVVGGPDYASLLSVVNLDSAAGTLTLDFVKDDGTLIARKTAEIAAKGKLYLTSQTFFVGPSSTATQGYLKITSSGPKLAGSVVFGDPGKAKFSAALPLVGTLQSGVIFGQLASNAQYFTGGAILNPNTTSLNATIEVRADGGDLLATKVETIPSGQRVSQLLTQLFPALASQPRSSGYFKVTADKPLAAFALFGTNDLSVLAAVPPQLVPAVAAISYDGTWMGTLDVGGTVEMTVSSNQITRFKVGLSAAGITCTGEGALDPPVAIVNGAFSTAFSAQGLSTALTGTFTSPSSMSGTYGTVSLNNFRCGPITLPNITLPGGTFTMSK